MIVSPDSARSHPGPLAEHGREALGLGADPLVDQLAPLSQDTDLTVLRVDLDANMSLNGLSSPRR